MSDGARDLINRMLLVNAEQRISVEEVFKHPWLSGGPMPSPEQIRAEMGSRAPASRRIGTRQLVHLLPDPDQWTSMGELRRTLQGGGASPFPRDSELRECVLSCGRVDPGGGDNQATRTFVTLTTFLTSLGMQPRHFSTRALRFHGCTADPDQAGAFAGEQIVLQVAAQPLPEPEYHLNPTPETLRPTLHPTPTP